MHVLIVICNAAKRWAALAFCEHLLLSTFETTFPFEVREATTRHWSTCHNKANCSLQTALPSAKPPRSHSKPRSEEGGIDIVADDRACNRFFPLIVPLIVYSGQHE